MQASAEEVKPPVGSDVVKYRLLIRCRFPRPIVKPPLKAPFRKGQVAVQLPTTGDEMVRI